LKLDLFRGISGKEFSGISSLKEDDDVKKLYLGSSS